ncbi:uncharacterized protein LOC135825315 [Sycon ciliatum]|uniref:uncharacterized protein LOC135825315 n=1 Tax=Sycon ciliatum TaxID=27933 RepID=UPI0031F717DD
MHIVQDIASYKISFRSASPMDQVSDNQHYQPTLAMDVHEPVANGLESVQFDVWQNVLLPMLSIPDIFQLCAVSKSMQRLLLNEYTFRRLCVLRYQLSPHLDESYYIRAAKFLFIADKVARRCDPDCTDYFCGNDLLLDYKGNAIVKLLSLALNPPAMVGPVPRRTDADLLHPLVTEITLNAGHVSECFPSLSTDMIVERCTPLYTEVPIRSRRYRIEDITTLLLEVCGSVEHYQQAIINSLQDDMPRLEFYLPYVDDSCRFQELAKGLHSLAKSDARICSHLGLYVDASERRKHLTCAWSFNPYVDRALPSGYNISDPVLLTNEWLRDVEELEVSHSVFALLVMGRLRTSQVDDYFTAMIEHEDALTLTPLPECSCPDRHDPYLRLGYFLLSSSQGQQNRKEWTKVDLVDAMMRYAREQCD